MAFDNIPMTRPALMTAAAALALYDGARMTNPASAAAAADALAEVIRRNLSKLDKAPAAPRAKPAGFRVDLVAALKLINKVVERRYTIPILSEVLLVASGDTLTLRATDLDMELEIVIPAPGIGCWTTTAPAKGLADVIGKGKGDVLLAPCPESGRLEVMVGDALTAMPGLDPDDFPAFPERDRKAFTMGAAPLLEMIRFIRPAVSTEETRYYLNGAYFHNVMGGGEAPKLRLVATDGHRLNLDEVDLPAGAEYLPGVIVPRKALDVVSVMLKDRETVEIAASPQSITYRAGNVTLTSKVIDGAFPDYMRVIPRDVPETFELESAAFVSGLAQLSAISQERSRAICLDFADGKVRLSAKNMEAGSAEVTMTAPHTGTDGEMMVGFNGKYLTEACDTLGAERVQFSLSHPDSPAIMRAACQPSRLTVLMPLRR